MDNTEVIVEVSLEHSSKTVWYHDVLAGAVAGSAGICVGHPFDTYKVRLQTGSINNMSMGQGVEVASLFRGLGPPFVTAGIVNAVIFLSYGTATRYCYGDDGPSTNREDSWSKPFVCGGIAGITSSVILAPAEHIKCRLQVDASYRGPMDALRQIFNTHGISGLYRGFAATCSRQAPSFGIYFSSYDRIKTALLDQNSFNNANAFTPPLAISALSGGIAGSLSWAVVYPMDAIKSRIQTLPLEQPTPKMRDVFVSLWRSQRLYRGIGITVIRAFPVNGIIFPVYEFCLQQLHQRTSSYEPLESHARLASFRTKGMQPR
jgi:solute carrier family 25 carnitine/acylcarnitine transporter 20/29